MRTIDYPYGVASLVYETDDEAEKGPCFYSDRLESGSETSAEFEFYQFSARGVPTASVSVCDDRRGENEAGCTRIIFREGVQNSPGGYGGPEFAAFKRVGGSPLVYGVIGYPVYL